jgi:hypothetical protein
LQPQWLTRRQILIQLTLHHQQEMLLFLIQHKTTLHNIQGIIHPQILTPPRQEVCNRQKSKHWRLAMMMWLISIDLIRSMVPFFILYWKWDMHTFCKIQFIILYFHGNYLILIGWENLDKIYCRPLIDDNTPKSEQKANNGPHCMTTVNILKQYRLR